MKLYNVFLGRTQIGQALKACQVEELRQVWNGSKLTVKPYKTLEQVFYGKLYS